MQFSPILFENSSVFACCFEIRTIFAVLHTFMFTKLIYIPTSRGIVVLDVQKILQLNYF